MPKLLRGRQGGDNLDKTPTMAQWLGSGVTKALITNTMLRPLSHPQTQHKGSKMLDSFDTPQSSTIVRVTYDSDQQILNVEFKNGNYVYYDVPEQVFEGMRSAPSKGQYLAQEIKGRYRYSRA